MLLTIIASVNLLGNADNLFLANADVQHSSKKNNLQNTELKKCDGDLFIKDVCDPVCEQIFKDIADKEIARKKAEHIFKEVVSCDNVCTCICENICDDFMGS